MASLETPDPALLADAAATADAGAAAGAAGAADADAGTIMAVDVAEAFLW